MKTSWAIITLLALTVIKTQGQDSPSGALLVVSQGTASGRDTAWSVTAREAHQRTWQRTTYEITPDGRTIPHVNQVIEAATGICFQQNDQWADSKEGIAILADGTAAAMQGQHKVKFPANIYQSVIELTGPGGERLKSQPIGLGYDDGANTVLVLTARS